MTPLFAPNPAIKRLAAVCDAIKASREAAGREHWNDAERMAFLAAAKGCGAAFDNTRLATVRPRDDGEKRIAQRDAEEKMRAAERRGAAAKPSSKPGKVLPVFAGSDDEDERPLELR